MITHGKDTKAIKFRNTDELIMSPHRGLRREYPRRVGEAWMDRDNAATPPINVAYVMDEEFSGYEGDLEDESDGNICISCFLKKKFMHVSVLWMFAIHYSTIFWGCVYNCIFMVIFVFIKFTVE